MTKPKISWPQTPADVRRFIGGNFVRSAFENKGDEPHDDDRYLVTAHDLLSAFSEWVNFGCESEPQPQQEPEAWMFQSGGVLKFKWHRYDRPTGEEALKYWKPLYTHPQPQRKPLTDDEIYNIGWELSCQDIKTIPEYKIAFARAIEAAHGIGGEA